MRKPGQRARGCEGTCAVLAGIVIGWHALVGHTQTYASAAAHASANAHYAEAAEKKFSEATTLSKKLTARDLQKASAGDPEL